MTTHTSAIVREEAPHVTETPRITISDTLGGRAELVTEENEKDRSEERIAALAEIICCAGEESAAALFVLMGTLQHSADPKVVANAVKHLAFTRCGELNVHGMVDDQIAILENRLLAGNGFTR